MENNKVKKLAEQLADLYLQSYDTYEPMVEDACSRLITEAELEFLFDHLLDVCQYHKNDELFFELCETYNGVYTNCVNYYKNLHKEIYEN